MMSKRAKLESTSRNGLNDLRRRWVPVIVLIATVLSVSLADDSGEVREEVSRPIETEHEQAVRDAIAQGGEALRMRWKLSGFLGAIASLFIPSTGEALFTFVPSEERRYDLSFLVTSRKREGEHFLYGAQVDERSGTAAAVWSSQMFRGELKQREQEVDDPNLIDYASAVYRLRWMPPASTTRMTIWDAGRTYRIEVEPLKPSRRRIAGEKIEVRGYAVRGVKSKGEPTMRDKIWIYFARDEHSTPVEIVAKRGLIKARIQLVNAHGVAHTPRS
jgi:hypothetical protein